MTTVRLSPVAYAKVMLHIRKHPHAPVNGYLLGERASAAVSADEDAAPSGALIVASDAIPLFHSHTLAPSLEAATQLIDAEGLGLEIVGYYHANERSSDASLAIVAEKIATKLDQDSGGIALVQVINRRLENPDDHALSAFGRNKLGWKTILSIESEQGSDFSQTLAVASAAMAEGLFDRCIDFDDHFEDPALDPRNQEITDFVGNFVRSQH